MCASRRRGVLATAAVAAALILGGAQAQAEYISVAELARQDGVVALGQPAAPLGIEHESLLGASDPQPGTGDPPAPPQSSSPLLRQPLAACNFGNSGAGSPSNYAPVNGPSSPPAGALPRPQLPQLEPTGVIPPQTGGAPPFFVVSFLFRPPRAV